MLIFFDDIPICSKSMAEHYLHLRAVFTLLRQNQMFAKASKCTFASSKVEYLGHFISENGVEIDPKKVEALVYWPTPTSIKELRSFLGLSGYYRKFIRKYAEKSIPLTDLLKKGGFHWSEQAQ